MAAEELEIIELTKKCPKRMMNGPCGGSFNGKCEVGGKCAWHKIYKQAPDFISRLRGIKDFEPRPKKTTSWLEGKKFLVTTEVTPPTDTKGSMRTIEEFLEKIKNAVDAVNVVDCPLGIPRTRGIEPSLIVKKHGLRPIMQLVCRNRTAEDIKKELQDAQGAGIEDILCMTGDWPKIRGVVPSFELDGTRLTALAKGNFSHLNVGVVVNPNVRPLEMELLKFRKKMRYADFAQSQAVFDLSALEKFAAENDVEKPILIGVLPLASYEMAEGISKVPGITISQELLAALKENPGAGIEFAQELIKKVKSLGFAGAHIMSFMDAKLFLSLSKAF